MLTRQIRIARENNTLITVAIIPDLTSHLTAIGNIDNQRPNRIGAVVESDTVARAHARSFSRRQVGFPALSLVWEFWGHRRLLGVLNFSPSRSVNADQINCGCPIRY